MILLLLISFLLFSTVCAQKTINDFQIDESYNQTLDENVYSLYLNENQDSGIIIYQYSDGDVDDDNAYDDLMHENCKDYLTPNDNFTLNKNSDNTANFTDIDLAQHGVVEVITCDGEDFVIVFWAKESSNVTTADLISQLNDFNKDNNVNAIAF